MDANFVEMPGRRRRRRYPDEFKASVTAACRQPGVSIASVALTNGLNANLLRKWVIDSEQQGGVQTRPSLKDAPPRPLAPIGFFPLVLPAPPASTPAPSTDIRVEVRRADTTITVTWPIGEAAECSSWLREILK